jgi:hypothetical protein
VVGENDLVLIDRDSEEGRVARTDVPIAGVSLVPPDSDEVTLWVLKIFDGHPLDKGTKRLHEYYREVHPPQSVEECMVEAEKTLRSFYGLRGWVKDSSPLAGFRRSWTPRIF